MNLVRRCSRKQNAFSVNERFNEWVGKPLQQARPTLVPNANLGPHQLPLVVRLDTKRSPGPPAFDAVVERRIQGPILVLVKHLVRCQGRVGDHNTTNLVRDVLNRRRIERGTQMCESGICRNRCRLLIGRHPGSLSHDLANAWRGGGRRGGVADQALRSPANHLPGKSWSGGLPNHGGGNRSWSLPNHGGGNRSWSPPNHGGGNRVRLPGRLNWSLSDFWDGLRLCDNGGDFGRCCLSGSRCRLGCRPAAIHILPCLVVPPTRNWRPTRGRLISPGQRERDRGEHDGGNCHNCGCGPHGDLAGEVRLGRHTFGSLVVPCCCWFVRIEPGRIPHSIDTPSGRHLLDVMEDRPFSGIGFGL